MKFADFPLSEWGGGPKDVHYAFFRNVYRGKNAFKRRVLRNGFAHFVWKVFARRKLLSGKFWVFAPLSDAFVEKIVNTRLAKIFRTIFAPDERLPSSATLILC